jgi:hypothetical protein
VAPETRAKAREIERQAREQRALEAVQSSGLSSLDSDDDAQPHGEHLEPDEPIDYAALDYLPQQDNMAPGASSSSSGPSGSATNSANQELLDVVKAMLNEQRKFIEKQNAALRDELLNGRISTQSDPAAARNAQLEVEIAEMQAKSDVLANEMAMLTNGTWTSPVTTTTSTTMGTAGSVSIAHRQPQPRFSPPDLPTIKFGEDVQEWISTMNHIVTSFGEEIVCPHILPRGFEAGDPIRDWYLNQNHSVHRFVTTGTGCWERFKTIMEDRFKPDLGVMQFEADAARRNFDESYAGFGIRKHRLILRAYDGASQSNMILKIKACLEPEVIRYCKEKDNIEAFIGELMDYDRTIPQRGKKRYTEDSRDQFKQKSAYPQDIRGQSDGRPTQVSALDKGKQLDRQSARTARKDTIMDRRNPETGKMCRSYLNWQGTPVTFP